MNDPCKISLGLLAVMTPHMTRKSGSEQADSIADLISGKVSKTEVIPSFFLAHYKRGSFIFHTSNTLQPSEITFF